MDIWIVNCLKSIPYIVNGCNALVLMELYDFSFQKGEKGISTIRNIYINI